MNEKLLEMRQHCMKYIDYIWTETQKYHCGLADAAAGKKDMSPNDANLVLIGILFGMVKDLAEEIDRLSHEKGRRRR